MPPVKQLPVRLYDAKSIDQLQWPQTEMAQRLREYWPAVMQQGSSTYVSNVQTHCYVLQIDNIVLPATVNDAEYENSYVCSFYAHYITYATYELACLGMPVVEKLLAAVLFILGHPLKWTQINKAVIVNNWLLSTNLYPELTDVQIQAITRHLVQHFPEHAIAFRSINAFTTSKLKVTLQRQGYRMVGSRQVYLYDPENEQLSPKQSARAKKNISRDLSLLKSNDYQLIQTTESSCIQTNRIAELYAALYLQRYSDNNPQFNEKFVALAQKSGFLEVVTLQTGTHIDGAVGFYQINGVMTAPLLGYDTALPKELGLYRILSSSLVSIAAKRRLISHKSSGVADFKRNRGFTGWIEYTAVFDRHLPAYRRWGWQLLQTLVDRVAIPLMKHYGL